MNARFIKALTFGVGVLLVCLPMCKMPTPPCEDCPPQIDTTSHTVSWTVDTIGAQGLIRDVWAFSRSDAWAVGEFYLRDSTGQVNLEKPYNAAHWDGVKWTLLEILVRNYGETFLIVPLYAIHAFSPTNVWLASPGGLLQWNGQEFKEKAFFITGLPFEGQVRKIWGTSESNIICVGRNGSIYRFYGTGWTKMSSGTTVDLEDVWGVTIPRSWIWGKEQTYIWTTGTTVSDGKSVVMQYDGSNWSTIYNNSGQPIQSYYAFSSVWTSDLSTLYLAGGSRLRKMTLSNSTFSDGMETGQTYVTYRVRATKPSDLFVAAAGGELAHYNGVSWYLYPELKAYNNSSSFVYFLTIFPTNDFVIIGGQFFTGLNGFPVVVRGYR